jgi:hypothetical protein
MPGRMSPVISLVRQRGGAAGFPEPGALITFDPFDSNTLGSYSASFGGWAISGGQLTPGAASEASMYATRGGLTADHVVGTILGALPGGTGPRAGICARGGTTESHPRLTVNGQGRVHVDLDGSGAPGYVTDPGFAAAGCELRLYADGTDLAAYVDGEEVWSGTTVRTSGEYGLYLTRAGGGTAGEMDDARFDHFQAWHAA